MDIKKLRREKGLTQSELADMLGVSKVTVSGWETGKWSPAPAQVKAISDFFGGDVLIEKQHGRKIPVLGVIPAGIPIEAITDVLDYEEISDVNNDYFALRIRGDSMMPDFREGDTIIFKAQNTCNDGQLCCVQVNGFDATFKKVRITQDGVDLVSLNDKYEPMRFKDVRILGVLAELRRKY